MSASIEPLSNQSQTAPPRRDRILGLVAVIVSVFIGTLTLAVMTPLLAMKLAARGYDGRAIGLNAAAGAGAILLVSLAAPWLGRRLGAFRAMMLSILVMAVGVGLLPVFASPTAWLALRFMIGSGVAVHWVISEVWINSAAGEEDRGKMVGLYVAAVGLAYLIAYPLLLAIATHGNLPFIFITGSIVAAAAPILVARRLVPVLPRGQRRAAAGLLFAVRSQPSVMGAALAAGFAIAVVLSFLTIYAERTGMTDEAALLALTAVAAGNVLLQVPIGVVADRVGAEKLLTALAIAGLAGLAPMPFLQAMGPARWPFLFVWGGTLGGFYTLSLTLVGKRFKGDELAGANAAFVVAYELGGVLGPIATGLGLDVWNPHGALVPLALAYAALIVGRLAAGFRHRPKPVATP